MQSAGHHGNIAAVIPVSGNNARIEVQSRFLQGTGPPPQGFFEIAVSSSTTSFFSRPPWHRPAGAVAPGERPHTEPDNGHALTLRRGAGQTIGADGGRCTRDAGAGSG